MLKANIENITTKDIQINIFTSKFLFNFKLYINIQNHPLKYMNKMKFL